MTGSWDTSSYCIMPMRIWNMPMRIMQIPWKGIGWRIFYYSTTFVRKWIRKSVSSRSSIPDRKWWVARSLKILPRSWHWLFIILRNLSATRMSSSRVKWTNNAVWLYSWYIIILSQWIKMSNFRTLTPETTGIKRCCCSSWEAFLINRFWLYSSFSINLFINILWFVSLFLINYISYSIKNHIYSALLLLLILLHIICISMNIFIRLYDHNIALSSLCTILELIILLRR